MPIPCTNLVTEKGKVPEHSSQNEGKAMLNWASDEIRGSFEPLPVFPS